MIKAPGTSTQRELKAPPRTFSRSWPRSRPRKKRSGPVAKDSLHGKRRWRKRKNRPKTNCRVALKPTLPPLPLKTERTSSPVQAPPTPPSNRQKSPSRPRYTAPLPPPNSFLLLVHPFAFVKRTRTHVQTHTCAHSVPGNVTSPHLCF